MKRIIAFVFAAVLVLSFCVIAGADAVLVEPEPIPEKVPIIVKSPNKGDKDKEHFPYIDFSVVGESAVPSSGGWQSTYGTRKSNLIVKFSNNTIKVPDVAKEPYNSEVEAARSLAARAVKDVDAAVAELETTDSETAGTLKEFFEINKDNLGQGVITIPEDASTGNSSVKLAVQARGVGIVVFEAPNDAVNLGYVILTTD